MSKIQVANLFFMALSCVSLWVCLWFVAQQGKQLDSMIRELYARLEPLRREAARAAQDGPDEGNR